MSDNPIHSAILSCLIYVCWWQVARLARGCGGIGVIIYCNLGNMDMSCAYVYILLMWL